MTDPATLSDEDLAREAETAIANLITAIRDKDPKADDLRKAVASLEAEQDTRRKKNARWRVLTLGRKAILLWSWHVEDLEREAGLRSDPPVWRPAGIGIRPVAVALGSPPPTPFSTPESGGPAPPGFGL